MGKKSSLDIEVRRAKIVILHGEGYTNRDAPAKLRCSKTIQFNSILYFTQTIIYMVHEVIKQYNNYSSIKANHGRTV